MGSLDTALQANKLEQVSLIMDRFESQVENLGVQTGYMDTAMAGSTSLTTPEDQVMGLMQQVADEHGLELKQQLGNVPMTSRRAVEEETSEKDSLAERLAKLRNL